MNKVVLFYSEKVCLDWATYEIK